MAGRHIGDEAAIGEAGKRGRRRRRRESGVQAGSGVPANSACAGSGATPGAGAACAGPAAGRSSISTRASFTVAAAPSVWGSACTAISSARNGCRSSQVSRNGAMPSPETKMPSLEIAISTRPGDGAVIGMSRCRPSAEKRRSVAGAPSAAGCHISP